MKCDMYVHCFFSINFFSMKFFYNDFNFMIRCLLMLWICLV